MRQNVRGRQKLRLKKIIIFSLFSAALLIMLTTIFNIVEIHIVKAKNFEIRKVEEQVFTTEMSLPSPEISHQREAGPNTIFIQEIKHIPVSSAQNHE